MVKYFSSFFKNIHSDGDITLGTEWRLLSGLAVVRAEYRFLGTVYRKNQGQIHRESID